MVELSSGLEGASSRLLLRLAAETMWLYLLFHILEFFMVLSFRSQSGFSPVWWIDCPGCADRAFSLPYAWPAIGGASVAAAVSWSFGGLLIFLRRARAGRPIAWVFLASTALHVVLVAAAQYPSPIAGLLMAVLMPAAAAVLATAALLDWSPGDVPTVDMPGSALAVGGLVAGSISMLLLGGLASPLLAGAYIVWAWFRVRVWQRRLLAAGALLAVVATVGRLVLANGYELYFWWV